MVSGYRPCKDGSATAEGNFDQPLDLERIEAYMRPLGTVKSIDGALFISNSGVSAQVYATGTVTARAADKDGVTDLIIRAENSIRRGMLCVGCGVCVGVCPINAITKEGHRVSIGESCSGCGECIGICPLVKFRRKETA